MRSSSPVRILLVDDHALFRESLRALLEEGEDNYRIVAEVATVADALELCRSDTHFDLAIIDYDLGPTAGAKNGVTVLRCLRERKEFVPALMIAATIAPKDIPAIVTELKTGIFFKADAAEELQLALQKTLEHEVWISSGLALDLVAVASGEEPPPGASITFDAREREILGLVVEGLNNREICSRLNLSEGMVKTTLQTLFEKAGVRTRAQLVRFAFESGNISL